MERIEKDRGVIIFKPSKKEMEIITLRKELKQLEKQVKKLTIDFNQFKQDFHK
jgi:conjugal transfer/entry exclusion protein